MSPKINAPVLFMKSSYSLISAIVFTITPLSAQTIWYKKPAEKWGTEALPIGNGRIGAMLFGGVDSEQIQFNEDSLWGGLNNWDGDYQPGDTGFGGYRTFGDVLIQWNDSANTELTSPSGHAAGNGQSIQNTTDSDPATKWCIENPGAQVIWSASLPEAKSINSYSITSAEDVPDRDPQNWTLEASKDGEAWQIIDTQSLNSPFEKRGETKSFTISKPANFQHYRIVFKPRPGASHFQVADIALAGVTLAPASNNTAKIPTDYQRSLNIQNGIHKVSFTNKDGVKVTREAFASYPDQVMVFHYSADKPGSLSGKIQLKPGQTGAAVKSDANGITFTGTLANKLSYAANLRVLHHGGKITASADGSLTFTGCDSLTLLLAARTDYKMSYTDGWRGDLPLPVTAKEIAAAEEKTYSTLRSSHISDLEKLLGSSSINLGKSTAEQQALPTDERVARYIDHGKFGIHQPDPELNVIIYQMGRYLLASSSRPGGLPANLQGLWNNSNNPAWSCDYHNNINVQMNYWPAETTGLSESALPLIDYIISQAEPLRIATRKAFGENVRGWTARTSQSPFGGNGWKWNIPASAWYALHVFDHWDFNRDETFLREKCYPMLKEICQYWEDRLKPLPDGTLVAPNGWSPEHGPEEDGVMHDQQLIWELFDDYLKAAKSLGVDADYQVKIAELQKKLAPNKIGKWGQLQEWQADRDDPNNNHRHTSHLFAVYPGRQISTTLTPDLAKAARISLLARSNDKSDQTGTPWTPAHMHPESIYSWVWPWRAAMWARLGEAERAYALVWGSAGNTATNMMDAYMPYTNLKNDLIQLDGSFGITAAIAEMLIQSHAGEISLIPALPKAWAKKGSFKGLRARGGHTVDVTWKDGKVTDYKITSQSPTKVRLRFNGSTKEITTSED